MAALQSQGSPALVRRTQRGPRLVLRNIGKGHEIAQLNDCGRKVLAGSGKGQCRDVEEIGAAASQLVGCLLGVFGQTHRSALVEYREPAGRKPQRARFGGHGRQGLGKDIQLRSHLFKHRSADNGAILQNDQGIEPFRQFGIDLASQMYSSPDKVIDAAPEFSGRVMHAGQIRAEQFALFFQPPRLQRQMAAVVPGGRGEPLPQAVIDLRAIGIFAVQLECERAESGVAQSVCDHLQGSLLLCNEQHLLSARYGVGDDVGDRLRLSRARRPFDRQVGTLGRLDQRGMLRCIGGADEPGCVLDPFRLVDIVGFAGRRLAVHRSCSHQRGKQTMGAECVFCPVFRVEVAPQDHLRKRQHREGDELAQRQIAALCENLV